MEKPAAKPQKAFKKYLKLFLKLGLTALALYLVFRKVNLHQIWQIVQEANLIWLLPALLFFVLSKWVNALRLQKFFDCIGLHLETMYNLKLYLVGMYYNLFLPGGMGGDGYKVILLRKAEGVRTRSIISASLLDRISGVVALGFLMLITAYFSNIFTFLQSWQWLVWAGVILAFPLYYLLLKYVFPIYLKIFHSSNIYSLIVQLLQLFSVIMILKALHINSLYAEYCTLFMLSTFAAMLPLTIGGIGAREAIFVYLPPLIGSSISEDSAVTLSLLFFLISAGSSLLGALIQLEDVNEGIRQEAETSPTQP